MRKTDQEKLRVLYWNIMEEIKARLQVIHGIYAREYNLPEIAAHELCYLELRMIFELIALACLTAHGDMPEASSRRLTEAYEPNKILNQLEKLHPAFYPIPVDQILDDDKKELLGVTPIKNGSLTRSELVKFHGMCGNFLHRGPMEKYAPIQIDFLKPAGWQKKIVRLLNRHFIAMVDRKRAVYVSLQDKITKKVTLLDLTISSTEHWPDWFREIYEA